MQSIRTHNINCLPLATQKLASSHNLYDTHLKSLKFKPYLCQIPAVFIKAPLCCPKTSVSWFDRYVQKFNRQSLTRRLLQLGGISLLILPVKGLMAFDMEHVSPSKFDAVLENQELVVATVSGQSTVFHNGDYVHGFGYDAVKRYAEHLGVSFRLKTYQDSTDILSALKEGEVDMVLGTDMVMNDEFVTNKIACNTTVAHKLSQHGLNTSIGFTFLATDQKFVDHSASFLCSQEQINKSQTTARFYDQTLLQNAYSKMHFERAIDEQLPIYQSAFEHGANKYNHDWQLLAAISYQESHLNPEAVSRTGVQGLMMLTNDTAKQMGVKNRTDAMQSIYGGAKYLETLEKLFLEVPETERVWFVLASYNMGPNAIKRIQAQLMTQNKNANKWSNVYAYMLDHANENSRYVQCIHYVANIRTYLEAIKTMQA